MSKSKLKSFVVFVALMTAQACGVKSAPTPVLNAPASILQQEAIRRKAEPAVKEPAARRAGQKEKEMKKEIQSIDTK